MVGAVHKINVKEMLCVMNNMKNGEASGLSRIVLEMLKAGGGPFLNSLAAMLNDILFESKLPQKWMLSSLEPILKGKRDPLSLNSYRGVILLELPSCMKRF